MKRVSIIGAGWAGLTAAVAACRKGLEVDLYEATPSLGGRARALTQSYAGQLLDNGQHILIGAYRASLELMRHVGLDPDHLLMRQPLDLRVANGHGLQLPDWPAPWHVLTGVTRAQGWSLNDKWRLLRASLQWQAHAFKCPSDWSVAQLCEQHGLTPRVVAQLIEPLCLSALNTAMHEASASVFLRVTRDALMDGRGSSDVLLPRVDLGALLPGACLAWLQQHGARVHTGCRVTTHDLQHSMWATSSSHPLIVATPPWEAARLLASHQPDWARQAANLTHRAIATVYLQCHDAGFAGLPRPMMALHASATRPAQFVFCRTQLTNQPGLLAAVVSVCTQDRSTLSLQVQQQVQEQLGLRELSVVQTVIEKRATLACTPRLERPPCAVSEHVWACGDYVQGPYPSTLEGAVRSALQVVDQI